MLRISLLHILGDFTNVFEILSKYRFVESHLLITQAFLKGQQKYRREIIDGCEGLMRYFEYNLGYLFKVVKADFCEDTDIIHNIGLIQF